MEKKIEGEKEKKRTTEIKRKFHAKDIDYKIRPKLIKTVSRFLSAIVKKQRSY